MLIQSGAHFKAKVLSLKSLACVLLQRYAFCLAAPVYANSSRAAAALAAAPAPRNIVSLASTKKLAPMPAHRPMVCGLAQNMPDVFPWAIVAAMIVRIATLSLSAPCGPIA